MALQGISSGLSVSNTPLDGVLLIQPRVFSDSRGFFLESFNKQSMAEVGISQDFVQDNHSFSAQNVVRGLHYQVRRPQGKLIRVVSGEIFDVAVDLRRSSPTFSRWHAARLSDENKCMLWIPAGLAHGFSVLSKEGAHVLYKATGFYEPECERTLAWNDPELKIEWQIEGEAIVSEKDRMGVHFLQAETFE